MPDLPQAEHRRCYGEHRARPRPHHRQRAVVDLRQLQHGVRAFQGRRQLAQRCHHLLTNIRRRKRITLSRGVRAARPSRKTARCSAATATAAKTTNSKLSVHRACTTQCRHQRTTPRRTPYLPYICPAKAGHPYMLYFALCFWWRARCVGCDKAN